MSTAAPDARRRRLVAALGLLAVGVLVIDQVSKAFAVSRLSIGEYVPLLGDFFGLMLVLNPGAAFSIATGSTWLLTIVAVVVVVVVVRMARRIGSRGWAVVLGALLGGALGNLSDRFFREPGFARGHVVDFLNYNGWFVGNVADIAIVLGAAGMAVLTFLGIGIDGARVTASTDGGSDAEDGQSPTEETSTDDAEESAAVESEESAAVEKRTD